MKSGPTFSTKRRELLKRLLKQDGIEKESTGISPRHAGRNGGMAPLSFAQERLWVLDRLDPGGSGFNIFMPLSLHGSLDVAILERCFNEVTRRHESLRTTFVEQNGQPVQVIGSSLTMCIPVMDLSALPMDEKEKEARRQVEQEVGHAFDLSKGPLLRVRLLRLNAGEHLLLLNMHHIISDGWSVGVLVREIVALYQTYITGQAGDLPDLPIQYADFAAWQREWLQGTVLQKHLDYWTQQLAGLVPLQLTGDRPRPAAHTFKGGLTLASVPPQVYKALQVLHQQEDTSLFAILLAAFKVLLYRYTNQTDICVGTFIANRSRQEIEPLIGYFINNLALRTDLSGNPSFRELLRRVRRVTLDANAHQDLPFEKLLDALHPERGQNYAPLFNTMFVLQNAPMPTVELPGLAIEQPPLEGQRSDFDLTLYVYREGDGLLASLEYSADIFDAASAQRMLAEFNTLLAGIIADPDQPISRLPLLTPAECQVALAMGHGPTPGHQTEICISALFEAQAARTPDAVALICGDEQLSYQLLNQQANRLARFLHKAGVGAEVRVGIFLERSIEQIVAILAVLKAGGAYVPLDPAYPQERLAQILTDGADATKALSILLSRSDQFNCLPPHTARVICLDEHALAIAGESPHDLAQTAGPENLAYLIYTSGSTGKPKGVMVEQRSLAHLSQVLIQKYALRAGERVLQFASFNFDTSAEEIYPCLLSGATLVLRGEDMLRSMATFLDTCTTWNIQIIDLPTAFWHEMVIRMEAEKLVFPESLRLVIIGGERALPERLATWQRLMQGRVVELVNTYGASEATAITTWGALSSTEHCLGEVSIGRPIPGISTYIFDAEMQPTPLGVPGTLYIGGAGLARGYFEQPDLTAERFIPDPFSATLGARLYCTGDLARFLGDGSIQYLGRQDHQVKIRGFRIELGEIEAAMRQEASIQDAVVVAREEISGERYLAAYAVARNGQELDWKTIRDALKGKLPGYMLPSAWVELEHLPHTSTGKVDRSALPAPNGMGIEHGDGYIPPRTPVEELLADVWAQVLRVEQVGVYDNFFELGGHSLLATQVISRLRQVLGVELPLRIMFETINLAQLAEKVSGCRQSDAGLSAPPLMPVSRQRPLPLSFSQQRLWLLMQLEPDNAAYNIPAVVRLSGRLNCAVLEHSLNAIVQRHETLRTTFAVRDEQPVQEIAPFLPAQLPIVNLEWFPQEQLAEQVNQLAMAEAARPFDLNQGPLLRVTLLHLSEKQHVLLITIHHIISDGWSVGVFIRELMAFYRAYLYSEEASLPALAIQYADFAAWQRDWLRGDVLEAQLAYWKAHLTGASPVIELPTDRPRPPVLSFRGAHQTGMLPRPLLDAVRALSRQEGVTPFMVLLTAFDVLLYRYSGQTDLVIGTPIANRNRAEIEGLIGFFVNTLALRADLGGEPTFRELVQRVRENALEAYAHQDLPFEVLVDALQPQRDLSHSPLFQVMFVLQNAPAEAMQLPGLTAELVDVESVTTQFDLTLSLTETDQGLIQIIEYSTDLFDAATITRLMAHYQALLESIVADPQQRISRLPFLTQAERQELLRTWNNTRVERLRPKSTYEIIEEQAEKTPEAIAVIAANGQLTYKELNRRANQLARRLRALGVGPDVIVGLCLNRSVESLVGILGILKAGGAYAPLDPAWPAARLAFALQDTHMPVLLTQQGLVAGLPEHTARVLCLDTDWDGIAAEGDGNLDNVTLLDHLAYVIYTSGSTGNPKGVLVSRRHLLHSIEDHRSYYHEPLTGYMLVSPVAFDSSVTGLFWTLCEGGALALPPDNFHENITCLAALIARHRLSHLVWVPSLYSLLLTEADTSQLASLNCVIVAGETCTKALVERHFHLLPSANLYNEYGPTENSVWSSVYRCIPDEPYPQVPIGFPIENVQAYVLDGQMQPVPVGVVGEVYLGGDGVTYGYLNQPALTAEKFLPDPFGPQPGGRLYRTGDLARYLPDGNLDFMGRCDHQIKLHGFRIELDEIEAALMLYPQMRETVVIIPEKTERLVAYLVTDDDQAPGMEALRRFLQARLPAYMIPSMFVCLDALPRTPTGKIDRRSLPDPESASLREGYVAPRTPLEQSLADIWAGILGLERVGIHDSFFTLGGDSITSIQVASRARRAGLYLTPRQLFQYQTIAELVGVIGTVGKQAEQGLVTGPAPLTPIQHWFFEQQFASSHHFNQAVLLKTSQPLDPEALEQALAELLIHHDALRMHFQQTEAGWQQVNAGTEDPVPFTFVDLSHLSMERQRLAIESLAAEIQASLNLAAGPLVRMAYWHLGAEHPGRLLVVAHHLVVDGVSWRIFLEDLNLAYEQVSRGEKVCLPAKTTSFKQWAEQLTAYARSAKALQDAGEWLNVDWGSVAALPIDDPNGANTVASEQTILTSLSAAETQALLQEVPPVYHTEINDALLAALALALGEWIQGEAVLVDLEGHGREEIVADVDLTRTVGWFTSVFPLRLDLVEATSPRRALIGAKEQRHAISAGGVHYGILKYLCEDGALALRRQPQAEIIFNYFGQLDQALSGTLFEPGEEEIGPCRSSFGQRTHLLEVNASISVGRLQLAWAYSSNCHQRSSIEKIAETYMQALREVITHCRSALTSENTAADFPAARLSQDELEHLFGTME